MILLAVLLSACERYDQPAAATPWQILVADTGHGRAVAASRDDGSATGDACLADLLPDLCQDGSDLDVRCLLFEVSHDLVGGDDTLTMAFGQRGDADAGFPGGVARVVIGPEVAVQEWRVDVLGFPDDPETDALCAADPDAYRTCRLAMPHAHTWLPGGEILAVTDTLNNRITFVAPATADPEGATDVVALLMADHEENPDAWWPNALDVIEQDGRTFLLVTYKGSNAAVTGQPSAGRILLWDITDLAAPTLEWAYPEVGHLAAVHGGSVVDGPDGPLLVYAHARGASDDMEAGTEGSVGFARWRDDGPPEYLGDLLLADGDALGFVRDVEIVDDGAGLLVTDSGCENQEAECERAGRILTLALELPEPPDLGGAWSADHADQSYVETEQLGTAFTAPLQFPFEADLLAPEERGTYLSQRQPSCISQD